MGSLIRHLADVVRAAASAFLPGPPVVSQVPEFPLRCQHCTARIRLLTARHPAGPVYRDEHGHVVCEPRAHVMHKPMPSVLG